TALALSSQRHDLAITVVEKEAAVARHQSGRNSGVIHSGLYYEPGSLKAQLCRAGADALVRFCKERGVPFRRDGKVVVATAAREVPALEELERRGRANGI
ncbi:MAG: FAD-dependent oxidoreductase, partial [Actinobacteria bacterium]|nr:FAD-dependent oxidoreductase [Actinomycetota bacterium]NIS29232.1 FAD-dependent oxidoreductase [Actinomycetota bacterium]NIU18023.1 FAD-dependent oxidoreductase [Actinomycetota bacterium]NIU64625.1 FAD-dependent oxidoreductase [Actinomycetota bacterium]NIV86299.1 FAD-dependent oxidoreductase [Actinomycetota bacterium]